MSEKGKNVTTKETGIEVDKAVFDSNGQILYVDDEVIDGIAGGLMLEDDCNGACNNTVNGANCK